MKTLKEFLINHKLNNLNKFDLSKDILTGDKLSNDDIREGMYVKLLIQGNPISTVYGIARKKVNDGVPVLWTYAHISGKGECFASFDDKYIDDEGNTIGLDAPAWGILLYAMDKDDYNHFISEFKKQGLKIPSEFLLD